MNLRFIIKFKIKERAMIEKYEKFLEALNNLLKKYFESQKDYIYCKEGCARCCQSGEYPFSKLEFEYAMLAYDELSETEKFNIKSKVEEMKRKKAILKDDVFLHECPFLINNKCSIYYHRGIICRTHGLMYYIEDKNGASRNMAPECKDIGLNYSNVYDNDKKVISLELWKQSCIETEPKVYNLSRKILLSTTLVKQLQLDFGETKPLINFFD